MPNYYAADDRVLSRQLKVVRLVIPFSIVHNATPANKVVSNDEPAVLFINAQGVTQISSANGALASGEATPTYDLSVADSTGDLNLLVKVSEPINKIMRAGASNRDTGAAYTCYHNSSNPDVSANGDKILLNLHTGVNLATTDINGVMDVEYVTNNFA